MIAAALSVLLLASALADAPQDEGAVVLCHDPARRIVQSVMRGACIGQIVSEGEAMAIREAEKIRRARILMKPGNDLPARRVGMSFGSAFAVSDDGLYLTARHVVEDCKSISLGGGAGGAGPAELLAMAEGSDIALLRSRPVGDFFPLDPSLPSANDSIEAIGYPVQGLPRIAPLSSEGVIDAVAPPGLERFIVFTAPVRGGNSGGPLLSREGNLLGMVVAKQNTVKAYALTGALITDRSFAISAAVLADFLEKSGFAPTNGRAPSNFNEPADKVYRVVCQR